MAPQSVGGADATEETGPLSSDTGAGVGFNASATAEAPVEGERPSWLPEAFKTEDEFKTWYDEQAGKPKADGSIAEHEDLADKEKPEAATEEKPKTLAEVKPEAIEAVKTQLKAAGGIFADPRYESAAIEFETLGTITPETMKSTAEAFGVPESAVQTFIDGQVAQRQLASTTSPADQAVIADLHAVAGGTDEYKAVAIWADNGGIPKADMATYDGLLDTNPGAAKLLLAGFVAAYKAAGNGKPPRDITSEANSAETGAAAQGYASSVEMQRDMADPKYAKDAGFRAEVARRVAASTGW